MPRYSTRKGDPGIRPEGFVRVLDATGEVIRMAHTVDTETGLVGRHDRDADGVPIVSDGEFVDVWSFYPAPLTVVHL